MEKTKCPYCKEEIIADAKICKHCHERVSFSKEELLMAAITDRMRMVVNSSMKIPTSISPCGALCHSKYSYDKARLNECLDNCKAIEITAMMAERLQRELILTFAEIVWGGGDIDPVPFEKAVRERFSHYGKPF